MRGLEWDPFCGNNLATGGGDGMVKIWSIPADGLKEDLTTPMVSINTGEQHNPLSIVPLCCPCSERCMHYMCLVIIGGKSLSTTIMSMNVAVLLVDGYHTTVIFISMSHARNWLHVQCAFTLLADFDITPVVNLVANHAKYSSFGAMLLGCKALSDCCLFAYVGVLGSSLGLLSREGTKISPV